MKIFNLFLSVFCSVLLQAQTYSEVTKLVASDRAFEDRFGYDVDIDGDYAVVGAYGVDEGSGPNRGAVYVYHKNAAGNWLQTQKLIASDHENYDRFGWSVSIDDSCLVVGSYGEDEDENGLNTLSKAGSAYIFELDNSGNWVEVQKIIASDRSADDEFGFSVDIQNETIVVGAHQDFQDANGLNDIHHAGSVYVFEKNGSGVWVETQKLSASDRSADINYPNGYSGEDLSDQFGHSVGVWGDYLIVGALSHDYDLSHSSTAWTAGAAYIFERNAGVWTEVQKIENSDWTAWDRFGAAVAIDTNIIAIGVWSEDESVTNTDYMKNSGSIYMFERDGAGQWNEVQKLTAGERNTGDHFGWDVKLKDNYLISGVEHDDEDSTESNPLNEAGSAYLFKRDENTGIWSQIQKISASDRDSLDVFGYAVGLDANNVIVGAFQHDFNAVHSDSISEAGAAYVFSFCPGPISISQSITLCANDSLVVGDSIYFESGTYTNTFQTSLGCDSTINTNLTVLPENTHSQSITICYGDSIIIGSHTYQSNGTYIDTLTSVLTACDSILTTTLSVLAENTYSQSFTFCENESVMVGTSTYTQSGNYMDTLTSVMNGCDSIVFTEIIVNNAFEISQNITLCWGDSYQIGNSTYASAGNYTDTLQMSSGCDSIVYTQIEVVQPFDLSLDVDDNEITANQEDVYYQWVDCNNNFAYLSTPTANEQTLELELTGNYAVILTQNQCKDTSACAYVEFTAVENNHLYAYDFKIYPNPTHSKLMIETPVEEKELMIIIFNAQGQIVFEDKSNNNPFLIQLDLQLPQGYYILQIQSEEFDLKKPLIID